MQKQRRSDSRVKPKQQSRCCIMPLQRCDPLELCAVIITENLRFQTCSESSTHRTLSYVAW